MAENCVDHFFGVAAFAENFGTFVGMFLGRVLGGVGPAFVIEIMEQTGEGPEVFLGAKFTSVRASAGLHRQSVLAKAFALSVFAEKLPGVVAVGHDLNLSVTMLQDWDVETQGRSNACPGRFQNPFAR